MDERGEERRGRAAAWLYRTYLLLALVGAIFPWVLFVPWLAAHGFAPGLFVTELFVTRPATIFAADVLYAAAVFVLFVLVEGRRLGMRHLWVYPFAVAAFGLCCALPLFLAGRERTRSRT